MTRMPVPLTAKRVRLTPAEYETREAAWAIVRNARDLNASGHGRAVRWARAYLGLDVTP